jgi:SAM-dependent methyltransferase
MQYDANERWWSERARAHRDTPLYAHYIANLRGPGDSLLPFDDRVFGDLTGVRALHLQCHIGTDTLSLAKRGATVTGVDFSQDALDQAARLAADVGLDATWVLGNATDLPDTLVGPWELVYTGYGALCWLHDLDAWAAGIAARLERGGRLVVIDGHPLASALAEQATDGPIVRLKYPMLALDGPMRFDEPGSYADRALETQHNELHEWFHGLGEIVQAVVDAGLVVERVDEHPEGYFQACPQMTRGPDGLWRLPAPIHGRFPMTFTLVARSP